MSYTDNASDDIAQLAEEFPSRVIVMLFDAAIEHLDIAIGAIEADDIEWRYKASETVAEILYQLCLGLDLENGGVVAANLAALYKHGIRQMTEINFKNDADIATALKKVLEPLRDSWAELDERIRLEVDEAEAMMDPAFIGEIAAQQHAIAGMAAR